MGGREGGNQRATLLDWGERREGAREATRGKGVGDAAGLRERESEFKLS